MRSAAANAAATTRSEAARTHWTPAMTADLRAHFVVVLAVAWASVTGCGPANPPSPVAKHWSIVRSDLDRVPLCAWGSSASEVWIGGGGLAADRPGLLMRGGGPSLRQQPVQVHGPGWGIHGPGANDVWAGGTEGP